MHKYPVDMSECPACHGALKWTIEERDNEQLLTAEARWAQYLPADCFFRALC